MIAARPLLGGDRRGGSGPVTTDPGAAPAKALRPDSRAVLVVPAAGGKL
jgi:hypothetical protein